MLNPPKQFLIIIIFFMSGRVLTAGDFDEQYYFNIYEKYRSAPENLMFMKHTHIIQQLKLISATNNKIHIDSVGESVQHRSINLVSFGEGPVKVLLWSQMHGNEPTATSALLAIFKYFANNFRNPFVQNLYNNISIYALVMLNPDGAQLFQRRNAYDIDINRDAGVLQTPEGQTLKKIKDRIQPDFGFNLHNMGGRETVEGTDKMLKIALMAPPFNKENADSPTRIQAKKLAVHIKKTLEAFIDGHIAKYKADYMPRAFGDAMQNWGVSTVLIESGSYTNDPPHFLEKMNFVALLSAFDAMANQRLKDINANEYDNIPLEGRRMYDILIRNAWIFNGSKDSPFYGDIGINADYQLKNNKIDTMGTIKDIGDLSIYHGKKILQSDHLIVTPGFIVSKPKYISSQKELFKNGITTTVSDGKNSPNSSLPLNWKPDSRIPITDIPALTSVAANTFKLKKKGKIKINNTADILIFSQSECDTLNMDALKYVVKNGSLIEIGR